MIYYKCLKCKSDMDAPDSQSGQAEICPNCGHPSVVPQHVQPVLIEPQPPQTPQSVTSQPAVPQVQQQNIHIHQAITPVEKKTNGLGVAALVMGILAAITCWIPFIGILGIPLAVIGCIFGGIGLLLALIGRKTSATMPISGLIVCIVSIFITVSITGSTAVVTDKLRKARENAIAGDIPDRKTQIITAIFDGAEDADYGITLRVSVHEKNLKLSE